MRRHTGATAVCFLMLLSCASASVVVKPIAAGTARSPYQAFESILIASTPDSGTGELEVGVIEFALPRLEVVDSAVLSLQPDRYRIGRNEGWNSGVLPLDLSYHRGDGQIGPDDWSYGGQRFAVFSSTFPLLLDVTRQVQEAVRDGYTHLAFTISVPLPGQGGPGIMGARFEVFGAAPGPTPEDILDNFSLAVVPEPCAGTLLILAVMLSQMSRFRSVTSRSECTHAQSS